MVISQPRQRVLTLESMNENARKVEYAVRGELAIKSDHYREMLKDEAKRKTLPFKEIVTCNIGNPQQEGLDQKPLTFLRQVAALTEYPPLLDSPHAADLFPADARARAAELLRETGSVGAYSHSKGVPFIRRSVAEFIEARDGYPADPEHIFLTAGASAGVGTLLNALIAKPTDGVLIPIPQYPLYTASLALYGARPVPYYLDESNNWALNADAIRQTIKRERSEHGTVTRALVVINPGNPTGGVLSEQNMQDLVHLAVDENLVIFADEVYQANVYDPSHRPFVSFKKVVCDMGADVELVSFHSISKGVTGECGRRGGYFELVGFDSDVLEEVYKLASVNLCPSLSGQIGVDLMVRPPKEGDESYPLWKEETDAIFNSYKTRSAVLHKKLNELEGISCNPAEGAMYIFPKLTLPKKAIEAAKKAGKSPDAFYCLALLDAEGICVVPGDGFGQEEGTHHYRTTNLVPGVDEYADRLARFHRDFLEKYKD